MLANKYLQVTDRRNATGTLERPERENVTSEEIGTLGYSFVAVGVYYCSSIDQFGYLEDGIVDPIVDPARRTWRLVGTEYVNWMAGMVRKAFESNSVSNEDLSEAILKFYRVRDRLEQEIAAATSGSEGEQHPPGGAGDGELDGQPKGENETRTSTDRTETGQAGRGSEGPAAA